MHASRHEFVAHVAQLHNVHCRENLPSTFKANLPNELLAGPRRRINFRLRLKHQKDILNQMSDATFYIQQCIHNQTSEWIGRFDMMRICGQPSCQLQISELTIEFRRFCVAPSAATELLFYRQVMLKAVLLALAGRPESDVMPWPTTLGSHARTTRLACGCFVTSDCEQRGRENLGYYRTSIYDVRRVADSKRKDDKAKVYAVSIEAAEQRANEFKRKGQFLACVHSLPTPLLHVRRIEIHCVIKADCTAWEDYIKGDKLITPFAKQCSAIYNFKLNDEDAASDEDCGTQAVSTSAGKNRRRFDVISKSFRRELFPVIGLIAKRFKELRCFAIVLHVENETDKRQIVHSFDDAVLAERVEEQRKCDQPDR